MMRALAFVLIVSGCASMRADGVEQVTADTYAEPQIAARNARQVLQWHDLPVRGSNTVVETGFFEALTVWRGREVYSYVECHLRGDDLAPPRSIMMNIVVTIHGGIQASEPPATSLPRLDKITVLKLRGSGRRHDGARCKLTDEFAKQLVEEMAGLGGRPPLRAAR